MAAPQPLKAYVRRQATVDAKMKRVLREAARQARAEAARLSTKQGIGAATRRAQLQLQEQQLRMWADLGTIIEDGIGESAGDVADLSSGFNKDLLKDLGIKPNSALDQSLRAQARSSVMNYLAREHFHMTLAERVYKNGQVSSGRIAKLIDSALLQGKSARELAADVFKYVNPETPGGASYAAMRLARTELNNAFHQASRENAVANPLVDEMAWKLSGSHPRPDECDALVGKYKASNVPDKPHPQCLCFAEPVPMSHAALVRRFNAGEFDQWADAQIA